MNAEQIANWYFTFGFGQAHPNCYVKINAAFNSAREEMFRRYGREWCMQYDEAKALEAIERWRMEEVQ